MFLILSCTSLDPSRETITSSVLAITSDAYFLSNKPVDKIQMLIFCDFIMSHKLKKLGCISASPPDITTNFVFNFIKEFINFSTSGSFI